MAYPAAANKPRQQARKEYVAPQTVAKVLGLFFVRTQPEMKEFGQAPNTVYVTEFLGGFGQKPDKKTGDNSGSISVKAFGDVAKFIAANVPKGAKVYLEGKLHEDKYTDKQGNARSKLTLIADLMSVASAGREAPVAQDNDEDEFPY